MSKPLFWLAVLGAIAANTVNAATLTVGAPHVPCPGATYSTIGAAIAAAMPGDTIEVCPALYPEQLTITKPVTLRGIDIDGVNRVLVQPSGLTASVANDAALGSAVAAVIAVVGTNNVTIENLAIDASNNGVSGCSPVVADIYYYNSSGSIAADALSGAQVPCVTSNVPAGSGMGILIDADPNHSGGFDVSVLGNTIERYTRNGIEVNGSGIVTQIYQNAISGRGPAGGVFQFGVFMLNGATGVVSGNVIHEGSCGSLSPAACYAARTEGVVLRAVGDGVVVDSNIIMSAQSGIFINGGQHARITHNVISDIDSLDGIDIQGTASGSFNGSTIENNLILNATPVGNFSCGIYEASGTGVSGNIIANNTVKDAYCGVAHVTADQVQGGNYQNTLYAVINSDQGNPPPTEP